MITWFNSTAIYRLCAALHLLGIICLGIDFYLADGADKTGESLSGYYFLLFFLGFPFGYGLTILALSSLEFIGFDLKGVEQNFLFSWLVTLTGATIQWGIIFPAVKGLFLKMVNMAERKED